MTIQFPVPIGEGQPLVLIGGMNVLESPELADAICARFVEVTQRLGVPYVFKASFDKANRTSIDSFRGPGLEKGLSWLADLRRRHGVPVLTDVHEPHQVEPAAAVCDVLQLPAFLARQTDLVAALARCGRPIHIKKPQFLSPAQMGPLVRKFERLGCHDLVLCERGTAFGYDNQVVDMLGLGVMRRVSGGKPISFDVTHALQQRDSGAAASGGRRAQALELARSGVAAGIDALFLEAHPNPDRALCDGPSALPLDLLEPFLAQLIAIDRLVKGFAPLAIA
ncbi:MAG: 3-deoxy-8-phosphooctulonate synthase [Cyanobacteriota bacterium]|jgi:2-dehydro-3-deoxyphosphooctonate aldolase (KDO 8-P synthase)|nr:3-deoxy-8-phosphooctulonate synthase [Cyanobacteriota bacterium]